MQKSFSFLWLLLLSAAVEASPVSFSAAHYRIDVQVSNCSGFDCDSGEAAFFDLSFSRGVIFSDSAISAVGAATWGLSELSLNFVTESGASYTLLSSTIYEESQLGNINVFELDNYHALKIVNNRNDMFPPLASTELLGEVTLGSTNDLLPPPDDIFEILIIQQSFGSLSAYFSLNLSGDENFISGFDVSQNWDVLDNLTANTSSTFSLDASNVDFIVTKISAVPIPATVWLYGSAVFGLIGIHRKKIKRFRHY